MMNIFMTPRFHFDSESTFNPLEVSKFRNVDWSLNARNGNSAKALFEMHEVRMRLMRGYLGRKFELDMNVARPLSGLSILDIGCGGGLVSESFAKLGANVTAVDAAEENIHACKTRIRPGLQKNINFINGLVEDVVDQEHTYDVVCCLEVIEHVSSPKHFLKLCTRLINRKNGNGSLIISTMNRTVKSYALAIVAAEHVFGKVPVGTHDWVKFVKPSEIEEVIHANGLNTEQLSGMMYNPFLRTWHLHPTNSVDVNYMLIAST
mmetsp:Transcript_4186/g.5257  ORF Transcript_4186/g.5257 Transcript_4186/m.5257 type:complete len:263 (-) Transcript_4186:1725-2513(-)